MAFYAHSVPGRPIADWEELAVHLAEVGGESAALAARFGRAAAGAAGLLHGVGKCSGEFQAYIRGTRQRRRSLDGGGAMFNLEHAYTAMTAFKFPPLSSVRTRVEHAHPQGRDRAECRRRPDPHAAGGVCSTAAHVSRQRP